ncbi:MAG TPA: hypothetical protein VMT25_01360 [Thermoanaerobaculia bacterium]|nr:hypothetical protein [Thermoanaerobaculia bacterium]
MSDSVGFCDCGSGLDFGMSAGSGANREVRCACGRLHDVELLAAGWSAVAQLTPERSVPVAGFSRDLRAAPDAERFWFSFPLRGDVALPVHILFSAAARTAEVKAADLKVHRVDGVGRATDARRQWIAWWQSTHRPHRSRGPSPLVPRRVGRLPVLLLPRRPAPASSR